MHVWWLSWVDVDRGWALWSVQTRPKDDSVTLLEAERVAGWMHVLDAAGTDSATAAKCL